MHQPSFGYRIPAGSARNKHGHVQRTTKADLERAKKAEIVLRKQGAKENWPQNKLIEALNSMQLDSDYGKYGHYPQFDAMLLGIASILYNNQQKLYENQERMYQELVKTNHEQKEIIEKLDELLTEYKLEKKAREEKEAARAKRKNRLRAKKRESLTIEDFENLKSYVRKSNLSYLKQSRLLILFTTMFWMQSSVENACRTLTITLITSKTLLLRKSKPGG